MRAVVQRVTAASVSVEGTTVASIDRGALILLGIGRGDGERQADELARRIAEVRMFADDRGLTNLSITDVGGVALVVSQFTLYADLAHGRRPGFTRAAPPERAEVLYERFCTTLGQRGVPVERGRFGDSMAVELVNDGPFTLWWELPAPGSGEGSG
jgi:D-tyrosyl-tRNA(Tyr) deacylase